MKHSEIGGIHIYKYPIVSLTNQEVLEAKVILFLGETGAGKTRMINYFVNAVHAIKYSDNIRYILIDEYSIKKPG
jgi:tRNA A37 threonylcarbamoyladenosine biosynthesis protein TsaE